MTSDTGAGKDKGTYKKHVTKEMSQRTLFEIRDRRHLIVNARLVSIGTLFFFLFSRLKFDRVPLRRPNLSTFFDSGHGSAYAANFLLTFLDHTRCGTRILRKQIFER